MKNHILFFDVANPAFIPLIQAIHVRGFSLVMNSNAVRNTLETMGVSSLLFEGFLGKDGQMHAEKSIENSMAELTKTLEGPFPQGSFSSSIGDCLGQTGQPFFQQLGSLIGAEIWCIETFEALLREIPLSLIVLGCDNSPTQRALILAASIRKIPTLQLAHGIPGHLNDGVAGEMLDLYSDYVAAIGQIHQTRLMENHVAQERIVLTGTPLWDSLYSREASMTQEQARLALNLDPKRPVVLFCTAYADGSSPYFPGMCRGLFDLHHAVLQGVSELGPDIQLIVRPHPNELGRAACSAKKLGDPFHAYRHWASERYKLPVHLIHDKKIESVRAADLVITNPSNFVAEAMILQRPVIVVPRLREGEDTTFGEGLGVKVVSDLSKIVEVIKEILDNSSMRADVITQQNAVLPEVNYGHDGKATYRVAALVEQLATSNLIISPSSPLPVQKPKSLRIVLAVHNFPPHGHAGTELYTYDVAKALQRRGHEVTVFYPVIAEQPQDIGQMTVTSYEELPVVMLKLSQGQYTTVRNEEVKPSMRKYFLEHQVDVVHIQHLMGLSTSFIEVLEELNIPIVLTANDFWFLCQQIHLVETNGMVCDGPETIDKCVRCFTSRCGPFPEERMPDLFHHIADRLYICKKTLKKVDLVLCPSEFLLKMFRSYGFEAKKMIHAPQGANLFNPAEPTKQSQDSIVFSYLGHIAYRKGLDLLIDAINRIDTVNAEFRIYGAVTEATYFGELMQRVEKGKNVIFYGAYSPKDLPSILSETHMAVVPSRGENYPFILREVLHGGIPVIASAVAGIPEIIRDGENGLLFKGGSADDLSDKIQKVIQSPSLITQFTKNIQPIKSIEQDVIEFENHYVTVMLAHSQSASSSPTEMLNAPILVNGMNQMDSDVRYEKQRDGAIQREIFTASIIIPVFNKVELTQQCLTHLAEVTTQTSYEVIVVNNDSSDGTAEFLSSLSGDIHIITNSANLGFAKACNQGAAVAKGKYLVFLNNDTIPKPGWLRPLVEEVESHQNVVVVGSKLLYPDNTIQHAGVAFCRKDLLPYHIFNGVVENHPAVNVRRELQVVTAACFLVRKESFEAVGGFDEGFINGFEDVDFCLKIREGGGKVVYQPKSVLYHLEHQSPGRKNKEAEIKNSRRLMERWQEKLTPDEDIFYVSEGYKNSHYVKEGLWLVSVTPIADTEEKTQWKYLEHVQRLLLRQQFSEERSSPEHEPDLRALLSHATQWPKDLEVLRWAAHVCHKNGFHESEWDFWTRMLEVKDDCEAREKLASHALKQNDLSSADQHIQAHLAVDANSGIGHWLQGVLLMQSQRYSEASESFRRASELGFDALKTGKGLGMAYLGMGKPEESWSEYVQLFVDFHDDTEIMNGLIQAGTSLERWIELVSFLLRFLERNPADCDMRFALAGVEWRAGHAKKSLEQLAVVRLLNPDFEGLEDLEALLPQSNDCTPALST